MTAEDFWLFWFDRSLVIFVVALVCPHSLNVTRNAFARNHSTTETPT